MDQGCIKPLCDLLNCGDPRVIQVSLDGLENILKVGEMDKQGQTQNQMAMFIEMADGVDKIHQLQMHENAEIYKKAYNIIDKYFSEEEDEVAGLEPEVDASGQFAFSGGEMNVPQGGFQFNQ